jgi:hypothetical protein
MSVDDFLDGGFDAMMSEDESGSEVRQFFGFVYYLVNRF